MPDLFQRDWLITVDTLRTSGLDCSFNVVKDTTRKPNKCSLEVRNLPEDFRDRLDGLSVRAKQRGRIRVEIEAGYSGARSLIFRGDLRTAESEQSGGTWTTRLEGEDGGRAVLQARVSRGYPPGTPVLTVVRDCAQALGVGLGNVEALAAAARTRGGATFRQGTVLTGNAAEELTGILRSCGLTWSVQDGVLSVLRAGQPLAATAVLLSAGTGLVDAPKPSPDGTISARSLIQPGLYPGGRVMLDTDKIRGTFGIKRINYKGDTAGRDWYADLVLRRDDGSI